MKKPSAKVIVLWTVGVLVFVFLIAPVLWAVGGHLMYKGDQAYRHMFVEAPRQPASSVNEQR